MKDTDTITIGELKDLLTPGCCHVSGMHDPVHFEQDKYICGMQANAVWKRLCEKVGIEFKPSEAVSNPDCYWCNNYPDKKHPKGAA